MREILFRGKRVDNGEWLYGDLEHDEDFGTDEKLIRISNLESTLRYRQEVVIPETVGQYTGLTDKNGKRIFEGDIIRAPLCDREKHNFLVVFHNGEFLAIPETETERLWKWRLWSSQKDAVVIGNIHDNPELMRKGDTNAVD